MNGKAENDILFSKSVKAGKRIYYVDVKRDRHDELYLSLTESKRIKEGTEELRPVFEKHKIFLYREDFSKFAKSLGEAISYVVAEQGEYTPNYPEQTPEEKQTGNVDIDIDF